MDFRWDWIEPAMPVPYVPTLGPVHPDSALPDLFRAVLEVAGTGDFLPYDKDRRWSFRKEERILVDAVEQGPDRVLVPTLVERGVGMVKVHVYGAAPGSLSVGADLAQKLAAAHGAGKARIVWSLGTDQPETYARGGTRVQLKEFTRPGAGPDAPVQEYAHLPEGAGFAAFAEEMAADGFRFLYGHMQAGTAGPVLTVLRDGRVAGAIGPMETMLDGVGRVRLLPQYFGVLPEHRGRGYGRALWRAAMRWGHERGAAYQLLQTEVGGASDRLCAAEGLTSLGYVQQRDCA